MKKEPPHDPSEPAPAPADPAPAPAAEDAAGDDELRERVIEAIKSCYDPEIPVNIYELGLIYKIDITPEHDVAIDMTLTSPACPVAGTLPPEVETKVGQVPGVRRSRVEVVWDPPWTPQMMTEAARLDLGMF
ncbi:MAG: SUF system Fe-S cluster assembly protein [Planctomycetes bacterium]|nr:SUF system Fe-S cluster assembly protein [Planctomycetota bacterium]